MVRLKHRYLLFNILYPTQIKGSTAQKDVSINSHAPTPDYIDAGRFVGHLRNEINVLFGDFGLGASLSSLKVIYFSTATSTVILRVPRAHYRLVWAALTHMTELPGSRRGERGKGCVIRVVRVSGTIRKTEEELIRRARIEVVRAKLIQEGKDGSWLTGSVAALRGTSKPEGSQIKFIEDADEDEDVVLD